MARRVGTIIERIRQGVSGPELTSLLSDIVDLGPVALPLVQAEMERRSLSTWSAMIYAMGAMGDPRVIPTLRRELSHQTGPIYMEILYALSLAGDPEAPSLALRSPNASAWFVSEGTAMDFIAGSRGPQLVPFLLKEIPRRGETARAAGLRALGTICDAQAVPFLLEWARQPGAIDRRNALMALARIGDPRGAAPLMEALSAKEPGVLEAAAEGIGYLREPRAVPALIRLARAKEPSAVRSNALWSLGLIGGKEAAATLVEALASVDERALVIQALGHAGESLAAEALAQEALGTTESNTTNAVQALASLPPAATADHLLAICTEAKTHEAGLGAARLLVTRRDPRAGACVVKRLQDEIRTRNGLDPVAEEILDELPLAATAATAASLESLAETVGAPALQYRVREAAKLIRMVQEKGANAKPWLETLDGGTPAEVDLAVMRLGEMGDPQAVEPLVRLIGRIEPERAWRIPVALGKLGGPRVTPALVSLLADDLYRVPSLTRAREEAARALAREGSSKHSADVLKEAYKADGGRLFVPLMAYARVRGAAAIPDLLELKSLLLRRRGAEQVLRHEKVNWAIRRLRLGLDIPLEEVRDVR